MAGETDKWQFYETKDGWRWRRSASNGNVVGAAVRGYGAKRECTQNAQRHGYEGNPDALGLKDVWEFYEDRNGDWRWRRTASNGELVGASADGYGSKGSCLDNAIRNGYVIPD